MRTELLQDGYYEPVKDRIRLPRLLPQSRLKRALVILMLLLAFVYSLLIGSLAWMQAALIYNPTAAIELNDPHWTWHDVAGDDGFKPGNEIRATSAASASTSTATAAADGSDGFLYPSHIISSDYHIIISSNYQVIRLPDSRVST